MLTWCMMSLQVDSMPSLHQWHTHWCILQEATNCWNSYLWFWICCCTHLCGTNHRLENNLALSWCPCQWQEPHVWRQWICCQFFHDTLRKINQATQPTFISPCERSNCIRICWFCVSTRTKEPCWCAQQTLGFWWCQGHSSSNNASIWGPTTTKGKQIFAMRISLMGSADHTYYIFTF